MSASAGLRFRAACPGEAHAIAGLHAGSWQRHYRGAFSDAFLDHDAAGYLLPLWTGRLATLDPRARTILAERDGTVVGLAHTLNARVWEGVHFRTSDIKGVDQGLRVARWELGRLAEIGL